MLAQTADDSVGDPIRRDQSFGRPVGLSRTQVRGIDLAIHNYVHNMDSFRVKLAGQGLPQHPKASFTDRQRGESSAAAERGCGAGKRDKTVARHEHVGYDRLGEVNRAHDIGFKSLTDLFGVHFEEVCPTVAARVMCKRRDRSKALAYLRYRRLNASAVGHVGLNRQRSAPGGIDLLGNRMVGLGPPRKEPDRITLLCKGARQRRSGSRPDARDDRHFHCLRLRVCLGINEQISKGHFVPDQPLFLGVLH